MRQKWDMGNMRYEEKEEASDGGMGWDHMFNWGVVGGNWQPTIYHLNQGKHEIMTWHCEIDMTWGSTIDDLVLKFGLGLAGWDGIVLREIEGAQCRWKHG